MAASASRFRGSHKLRSPFGDDKGPGIVEITSFLDGKEVNQPAGPTFSQTRIPVTVSKDAQPASSMPFQELSKKDPARTVVLVTERRTGFSREDRLRYALRKIHGEPALVATENDIWSWRERFRGLDNPRQAADWIEDAWGTGLLEEEDFIWAHQLGYPAAGIASMDPACPLDLAKEWLEGFLGQKESLRGLNRAWTLLRLSTRNRGLAAMVVSKGLTEDLDAALAMRVMTSQYEVALSALWDDTHAIEYADAVSQRVTKDPQLLGGLTGWTEAVNWPTWLASRPEMVGVLPVPALRMAHMSAETAGLQDEVTVALWERFTGTVNQLKVAALDAVGELRRKAYEGPGSFLPDLDRLCQSGQFHDLRISTTIFDQLVKQLSPLPNHPPDSGDQTWTVSDRMIIFKGVSVNRRILPVDSYIGIPPRSIDASGVAQGQVNGILAPDGLSEEAEAVYRHLRQSGHSMEEAYTLAMDSTTRVIKATRSRKPSRQL